MMSQGECGRGFSLTCEELQDKSASNNDSDSSSDSVKPPEKGVKRGEKYTISISEEVADNVYNEAGTEEKEVKEEVTVLPSPLILTTSDERLILDTKRELNVLHDLDTFLVQTLLIGGRNQEWKC